MLRFTAKGRIQVWDGEVLISSHVQEREAYERIAGLAPGKYTVTFPVIEVVSSGAFKSVYSTSSELGRVEARGMAVQVVRLLSDTTPPAVPSGFSATASTATTVTLTLTANGESDFSNYVLERSSDNIGWGYLKSFTGTSTTDTVDISGSTYYYRAFSIDTRGNRSAYTAVKSAGPYSVGLSWDGTVPNVTFTRGNAQNFDLSSYIIGSPSSITLETGTLPAGVTLNSDQQRLEYDGSSATSSAIVATGISLRLNASYDADWLTRSTASGVFYSHNFTYYDAAKTLQIASSANLRSSFFGVANPTQVTFDTSIKLSGNGSCRLSMPASSPGTQSNCQISFQGLGASPKTRIKNEFYVQFAYYADATYRNFYYGASNAWGGKIAIIESADSSFDPGEIVLRRANRGQSGLLDWYKAASGTTNQDRLRWAAAGNEETIYNFYDLGSGTVSSLNTLQARYGPTYSDRNSTTADADIVASGAPVLPENGWMVFEIYIKQVSSGTSVVKIWCAPYGSAPTLIFGSMNANLPAIGALDGASPQVQIYNGMQLLNYHNTATNWPGTDTFVCYDEVICSDNPINFPGGHVPPFTGTTTPTGYPPSGSVVVS